MKQSFYLVAGLGKTGLSIAHYLRSKQKPFVAFDTRKEAPGLDEFHKHFPEVPVYLQDVPQTVLQEITDIIASPGLSLDNPLIQKAQDLGLCIYGDIECLARELKAPVIAITGTNGKSTVTTLVGAMAEAAGLKVAVAGNIGRPVLDMLLEPVDYDLWVLELSSFQLDLTHSLSPKAACILNISPDHLDRHHHMDAYVAAKQRIYRQATTVIYNRDDLNTVPNSQCSPDVIRCSFGSDEGAKGQWGLLTQGNKTYLAQAQECILPTDSLLIKGIHNWLNALAAAALAKAFGIPLDAIVQVLKTFSGLPHRCQWVRALDGVDWINDSKGTNIGATISAINGIGGSMQGKIVLIAGGQGKGADFSELTQAVCGFVRCVVLIGEDADKIESALHKAVPLVRASSLEGAVVLAKTQAKAGDVVLLSPACASLDMFRDFNHRGDVFASSVIGL